MYEHKQAALLILHLFQACSEELLWHVLKLEADKSGEDLNIFNSVPQKGNHVPWWGPLSLSVLKSCPRKHGPGSIKADRTSCSLIKILWNSGSANGLLLGVCRYVGCLGSFKERCQPNVFPVTCTAEGNVLPKGPTSRWISFCSH